MAADRRLNFFQRRILIALHQRGAAYDQAWRAEAALRGIMGNERGLNRVQLVAMGKALDRHDLAFANISSKHHARGNGHAIDPDGTGRARAAVAANLRPGQIEWAS